MSIFGRLFGSRKGKAAGEVAVSTPPEAGKVAKGDDLIKAYDKFGREILIEKDEWRKNVLPGALESKWNNPEQLYGIILGALNDGFRSDVVRATEHLYRTDPAADRGACLWGIVLMEEGRLDEAEEVLRGYMSKHGEDGVVLTNLAKVYSKRGKSQLAEETLWHALELDPNQDNGMGWYEVIHRERGGEIASLDALRRVAALPSSWRAQLWLARNELKSRQLSQALTLYRDALVHAGNPKPWDLLMQMSGDLGNTGHLIEILELVPPCYEVGLHGLQVGNNLLKTYIDLGQLDAAQVLLDQLYSQNRPDWREHLSFWDTEIAKARVAVANKLDTDPPKIGMMYGRGPVWLNPESPATELFPAKVPDAVKVCFVMGTCEIPTNSRRMTQTLSDTPGRLSRAIPLFLAEQVEFASSATSQTLVPWISEPRGAFALCGGPWEDAEVCGYAREGNDKSDYIVTSHLRPVSEPWSVETRLIRAIDGKCLGQLSAAFTVKDPADAIQGLARDLLRLLAGEAQVGLTALPPEYKVPGGARFPYYLLRLEQLLAVRCNSSDTNETVGLSGEREIIDGNIQQCLEVPDSVNARILLAQTLVSMKTKRPQILHEFKSKVLMMHQEFPLESVAQGVVQRLMDKAFN